MAKVHIDISLFTKEAAFGMISGPLEIEVIPQVDDQIAFRLSRPVEAYCGELPFGGQLRVTNRIIGAKAEDGIILVLEDLTGATTEDARQLLEMFEKDYGLFGDVWEQ